MQKQQSGKHQPLFSWFDDPSEPEPDQNYQFKQNSYPQLNILMNEYVQNQDLYQNIEIQQDSKSSPSSIQTSSTKPDLLEKPKAPISTKIQEENEHQSIRCYKDTKDQKQHLYSKAYRERKKQRYKILEDENVFLKKRIKQLQYKLRQQQIELNRLKFPPPEKQLSLEQFRREFLERTVKVLNQHKSNPLEETKQVYTPQDPFYHQFLDIYAQRGFAGSRKTKLLNYHFNEILEAMLKDSERYLVLMFTKSKSWQDLEPLPEYDSLHTSFYNVFKLDEDLKSRLKYFVKNLYPLHIQLTKHTSQFYKGFQDILQTSQKIHNFIQQSYLSNMDVARKRIELQTWFEFHKYSKSMRKLRFQWLELIKQGSKENEEQGKRNAKGTKRKKILKDEDSK